MKDRLLAEFKKFNIDAVGITDADLYNSVTGENYSSVIVALFPYYCGEPEDSNISMYTHGYDYHSVIKSVLNNVCETAGLKEYKIHSDIGPSIERTLAVNSGLCFLGKNGMCINQKYGSYFFIGYIVCTEALSADKPNDKSCLGCMKCIAACPGKALSEGFAEERCLSAITQKRGALSDLEAELIRNNNTAFGCDICQKVCPHNANVPRSEIAEFTTDLIPRLELSEIQAMSNRDFMKKYKNRSFAWRGKKVIERNLKIIEK